MIMENLRLYGCALTNGSNHLTNNLSVTALTRLLPVFLMMIFLGIGTDVLCQERNTITETAIFDQDHLNTFDGTPKTDEYSELSSGGITLSSSGNENVQAAGDKNKGTKVRTKGAFTIKATKEGATITSITLITDQKNYKLDSSVSCTETLDGTGTNRTYTFSNGTQNVTFTNNNPNKNIYVSNITVN